MPSRLAAPVLTVDAAKMHKVDPRNVESLFGMWMVFSKCAESIEGGKRLENLSWRLWNRETFCCEAQPQLATTPAINVPLPRPSSKDVPELSASVDSAASDDSDSSEQASPPSSLSKLSPSSEEAEDSALSRSRGKEKHITSLGLEKMIINIKEKTELEPLSSSIQASLPPVADTTPRPSSPFRSIEPADQQPLHSSTESCFSAVTVNSPPTTRQSDHRGSDTSVSSGGLIKSGSVVHGFSPSQMSSSFRQRSNVGTNPSICMTSADIESSEVHKPEVSKKKLGMFTLGGSSGEDDDSSYEDRMGVRPKHSSLSESLKKSADNHKVPSFKDMVQSRAFRTINEGVNEDEDAVESDDGLSESAIDDDEDDDEEDGWEDSIASDRSSPEEKPAFQRVDSRMNLVSRRSMLTTMIHEPERAAALANAASRSTPALRRSRTSSPTGPSLPASPEDDEENLTMRGPGPSRGRPIIVTTSNIHAPAHSPRTTRRNMLATELPESLRKSLLWERQQKNTTANAVFKRRHTAQNMANLQEYPDPNSGGANDTSKNNSWNHYFDAPWEFNARGW